MSSPNIKMNLQDNFYTDYKDVLDFKTINIIESSYLKIFHLNICSLNKHHDELLGLLATLKIGFDIIVLSELWVYNLELYKNILPGFNFHFNIDTTNQASGIGIFISSELDYDCQLDFQIGGCEYIQIQVNVFHKTIKHKYYLHCIYRHPGPLHPSFNNDLENYIKKCKKINKQIIIGDININILDAKCPQTNAYLDMISEYSFLPLILKPTRITDTGSTLIDHIMYNGYDGHKIYSGNIFSDISDHLPNYAFISLSLIKLQNKERPLIRIHTKENIENFVNKVSSIDWAIDKKENADYLFNKFYSTFQTCYEESFSLKKYLLKSSILNHG